MGSGFSKKKKQAKALAQQFEKLQEEMKNIQAEGSAGNGLVTVTLNGDHELVNISIKPDCVDPEDVEGLEDLIRAAFAEASKKIKEQSPQMPDMGGLGLPGGLQGMFGL